MIGKLTGLVEFKKPPFLLLEVNGVGYEIQAPMSTFYKLPELNQKVSLFTHLSIREDAHLLFGFYEEKERILFRTLIKVSGVGPKLALAILSGMDVENFIQTIERGEIANLVRLPGVGKKTAERLVIEMRDRLSGKLLDSPEFFKFSEPILVNESSHINDAINALIVLGYKPQEARIAITKFDTQDLKSDMIIRKALQGLSK
ncbi:MAG: Holliday junction helicase ruvA [Francisellaceae bacterium]|nr:Holliday junction helicase ruvA [Francisellaceae bacterium]